MTPTDAIKAIAALEDRTKVLLEHTDKMRAHIEAHEFEMAAKEAERLALYCKGADKMAQRLADANI
jgi:hypothetical protein